MKTKLIAMAFAISAVSGAASAKDCGEVPHRLPHIPAGESTTAEDIRLARDAVVAFSNKVDAYLACMDSRAAEVLPYMTKEQQVRWDEDLADLHDKRRELQTRMNEAIRAYRRSSQ